MWQGRRDALIFGDGEIDAAGCSFRIEVKGGENCEGKK